MWRQPHEIGDILDAHHYLGATRRGQAWVDDIGIIVIAAPTGRHLPARWLEVTRWCILDRSPNAGSRQWGGFVRALRRDFPETTTIVSYSDPAAGHDGALYRACNWRWAPTWHRLRPPPTGNGAWREGEGQGVKDRWVFLLRPEEGREERLQAKDEAVLRKWPWARYVEPQGASFRRFQSEMLLA